MEADAPKYKRTKYLLDNGASVSVTGNAKELTNLEETENTVRGIVGPSKKFDGEGKHPIFGKMLYLKGASASVLSMGVLQRKFHLHYSDEECKFRGWRKSDGLLCFTAQKNSENIYPVVQILDPLIDKYPKWKTEFGSLKLVSDRLETKAMAEPCIEMHRTLIHTSKVQWLIEHGHMRDLATKFVPEAFDFCEICIEGKDTRAKGGLNARKYKTGPQRARYPKDIEAKTELEKKHEEMSLDKTYDVIVAFDIVFHQGWSCLLAVVHPIVYFETVEIKNKTKEEITTGINLICARIEQSKGINKINSVYFDGEKSIGQKTNVEELLWRKVNRSVANKHNSKVEPYVRFLRNAHRTCMLEYQLNKTIMISKLAWKHAVQTANYLPNKFCGNFLPIQVVHQYKTYRTPVRFGKIVEVADNNTPSKYKQITRKPAVVVGYSMHSSGINVKLAGRSEIGIRGEYVPIPEDIAVRKYLEMGSDTALKAEEAIWLDRDEEYNKDPEEDMFPLELAEVNVTQTDPEVDRTKDKEDEINVTQMKHHVNLVLEIAMDYEAQKLEMKQEIHEGLMEVTNFLEKLATSDEARKHELDQEDITNLVLVGITNDDDKNYVKQLEEESKIPGKKGKRAAGKLELFKLLKIYKAMVPADVPPEKKHLIVPAVLLQTEKKNANGEVIMNKGRFVGLGNKRQQIIDVLEKFSPTASYSVILLLLNIILKEKMDYAVMDVTAAYVQSSIERETYIKASRGATTLMVEIDPNYAKYVKEDGTMDMKLLGALYGLEESGRLWGKALSKSLLEMGFKQHPLEHCLYHKDEEINGKQERLYVLVYVDDLLIGGNKTAIEIFMKDFSARFDAKAGPISPTKFEFLKMQVRYDPKDESFNISQPGFIQKLTADVDGTSAMPHSPEKLLDNSDSPLLENPTEYRTLVMSMMYAARVRMDIKPTLSYLTTKCQSPNERDMKNAKTLLNYLNGTRDFELRLKPMSNEISGSADASWGSFPDGTSSTGTVVTMGAPNAPIIGKGGKQSGVPSNSTAVSELKAVGSTFEETLWLREMMRHLGYDMNYSSKIENDNKSCITLCHKGPSSSGRTKWIEVKNFWIKAHLENKNIDLHYTPSEKLLADGFTKPLSRKAFEIFRARVLNFKCVRNNE